jgi:hypothetical protein
VHRLLDVGSHPLQRVEEIFGLKILLVLTHKLPLTVSVARSNSHNIHRVPGPCYLSNKEAKANSRSVRSISAKDKLETLVGSDKGLGSTQYADRGVALPDGCSSH